METMKTSVLLSIITVYALLLLPVVAATAAETNDDQDMVRHIGTIETELVESCHANKTARGYYGASFEPCEFAFFQFPEKDDDEGNSTV